MNNSGDFGDFDAGYDAAKFDLSEGWFDLSLRDESIRVTVKNSGASVEFVDGYMSYVGAERDKNERKFFL
jgi:hypothetical protein